MSEDELRARYRLAKPKGSKYHAIPTVVDGILFASRLEARRWHELRLLEQAGEITKLSRQVPFPLSVNGVKLGKYVADFIYDQDGHQVVEDAKGLRTPLYRWKAKHLKAEYGITILETGDRPRKKRRRR